MGFEQVSHGGPRLGRPVPIPGHHRRRSQARIANVAAQDGLAPANVSGPCSNRTRARSPPRAARALRLHDLASVIGEGDVSARHRDSLDARVVAKLGREAQRERQGVLRPPADPDQRERCGDCHRPGHWSSSPPSSLGERAGRASDRRRPHFLFHGRIGRDADHLDHLTMARIGVCRCTLSQGPGPPSGGGRFWIGGRTAVPATLTVQTCAPVVPRGRQQRSLPHV